MTASACVPATLVAGDTFSFAFSYNGYAPPDWVLDFVLRPHTGGSPLQVLATDTGTCFEVTIPAATTTGLSPGQYLWTALHRNGVTGQRFVAQGGRVVIKPDPVTFTGDQRSDAERILAAIDATIEGRASKDADTFTIEGRSIGRTPIPDLMRLRGTYEAIVRRERRGSAIVRKRVRF